MKAVIGLGNPGRQYAETPHNVGFLAVNELARRLSCTMKRSWRHKARMGKAAYERQTLVLVKPQTYMNRSGDSIGSLLRAYDVSPSDMVVVLDDAALEIGRIRIRPAGSSGGHKGLGSIIQTLEREDFPRIRIGVGPKRDGQDMVEYVLTPFSEENLKRVAPMISRAADAVLCVLGDGIEEAMNRFNGLSVSSSNEPVRKTVNGKRANEDAEDI